MDYRVCIGLAVQTEGQWCNFNNIFPEIPFLYRPCRISCHFCA